MVSNCCSVFIESDLSFILNGFVNENHCGMFKFTLDVTCQVIELFTGTTGIFNRLLNNKSIF
ncbi:MAG: hypothetical protein WCG25_02295 [bacterium]